MTDNWDAELNAWILSWDCHQLFADPTHLFDGNIFYPARYSLAFSENLFGIALLAIPLFALGMSYIQVYNILLLLGFLSSALAAWALARYITADPMASLAAALLFAFVPWRFAQISHLQFQWGAFLALALLFLLRYLQRASGRDLALYGVFLLWNALTNIHYAIFSVFMVFLVLLEDVIRSGPRGRLGVYGRVALASVIAATLFLPVALAYSEAAALYGFRRTIAEAGSYSARLKDFLDAGQTNRLYGWIAAGWKERREAFFPGVTLLLCGVLGATGGAVARPERRAKSIGLLLTAAGIVLALGTSTPLYSVLYRAFGPLLQAIRVPARGIVLMHLGLGVLAALGLSIMLRRVRHKVTRVCLGIGVLGVAAVEYASAPLTVFWADPAPAPVYRWIAASQVSGGIVELPFGLDYDIEYVFRAPTHFRPILNGYSGFFPRDYDELNAQFEKTPIARQVWTSLERSGAKVVVYHPHFATAGRELDYANLLRSAVDSGRLVPLRTFRHAGRRDFVFELGRVAPELASYTEKQEALADFSDYSKSSGAQASPPIGWLDVPRDGQRVSIGERGYGWALAKSGVAEVRLTTGETYEATLNTGEPHPGVFEAHPNYPGADRAGFSFSIPLLSPGVHALYFTIVARDGGEAVLERWVRVKQGGWTHLLRLVW